MAKAKPKPKRINDLAARIGSRRESGGSITKSSQRSTSHSSSGGKTSRSLADAIGGKKTSNNGKQHNTRDVIGALRDIQNKQKPTVSKTVAKPESRKAKVEKSRVPPPPAPPKPRAVVNHRSSRSKPVDAPKGPRATRHDVESDTRYESPPDEPHVDDSFSFKNASAPPVLRLSNLANGTSAADVRAVLAQVGRIVDCGTKLMDDQSVTAETVFEHDDHASVAAARFDNTYADGRRIRAVVTKVSTIPGLGSNVVSNVRRARVVSQPSYIDRWSGPPLYSDYLRAKQR